MLRPQQMGQKIIGTGKVVDLRLPSSSDNVVLPTHNVPVVVSAVESSAEGVISVGQLVLWPREQIVLPRTRSPSSTNAMIHNQDVEQPSKLPSPVSDVDPSAEDDGLMNYALQCIQLGTVLMQLNDTEKEGDGERSLINWKLMMIYFRSRTRGAKYAYEAMRFITFVKALYTERMAHRILHGQFVNEKGGSGNNCANDLRMEMLVKTNKNILQGMCGNKTLTAVQRSTRAAHGLEKSLALLMNNAVDTLIQRYPVVSPTSRFANGQFANVSGRFANAHPRSYVSSPTSRSSYKRRIVRHCY